MNFIKKVIATWYRYYSKGPTAIIAYQSAIIIVGFFFLLNISVIVNEVFGITNYFFLDNPSDLWIYDFISMVLIMLPVFFLLAVLFKKKEITKIELSDREYKRNGYFIIVYVILSITIATIAALYDIKDFI